MSESTPTHRQVEVLRAIAKSCDSTGYAPTMRELGDSLGIRSTNGVASHLQLLERKGLISKTALRCRTIKLTTLGAMYAAREAP